MSNNSMNCKLYSAFYHWTFYLLNTGQGRSLQQFWRPRPPHCQPRIWLTRRDYFLLRFSPLLDFTKADIFHSGENKTIILGKTNQPQLKHSTSSTQPNLTVVGFDKGVLNEFWRVFQRYHLGCFKDVSRMPQAFFQRYFLGQLLGVSKVFWIGF